MIILLATLLTHSEKNFFDGAIGKSQFLFLFRIALLLKSYMSMVFFGGFLTDRIEIEISKMDWSYVL